MANKAVSAGQKMLQRQWFQKSICTCIQHEFECPRKFFSIGDVELKFEVEEDDKLSNGLRKHLASHVTVAQFHWSHVSETFVMHGTTSWPLPNQFGPFPITNYSGE